jgi:uncharacterized damage-inducible protein DinB
MPQPTTTQPLATRPADDEYLPYYAKYITRVPDGDLLATLESQLEGTMELLDRFGEEGGSVRYAPGKWSVKQVVGHITDAERVFTYRAMCAARGESAPLPGFDENAYTEQGGFDARTLDSLAAELTAVRRASLALFRNMSEEDLSRRVIANGAAVTPRALAWIIAGHERHHAALLAERYLPALG